MISLSKRIDTAGMRRASSRLASGVAHFREDQR